MKRIRFTTKLTLYHLLILLAVMLTVITVFYFWVVRDAEQRARKDFGALTEKTAGQFDTLLYNMDKTALQIAANPNIVTWFGRLPKGEEGNYFIENPLLAGDIVTLLNSYNFKKDGNTRICLYNDEEDFVYSATTMTTVDGVESFFDSQDFQAVQRHFSGNTVFSVLRNPGPDILNTSELPSPEYFSIIRQIKDYYSGTQKNGYVEVQQSVERMDEIFGNLGEECSAAVLDNNGALIYAVSASDEWREESVSLLHLPMGVSFDGGKYYARYQSDQLSLDVVFCKPSSSVTASMEQFAFLLIGVFAAVFTVALIGERLLVQHLSRPLEELSHSVKNVTLDHLKLELTDEDGRDEVQALNQAFDRMLRHLQRAMDERVISETNEWKAHLFALQSQMNPHFLYNILAVINMEAEIHDNEKIAAICQALSRMMKYSSTMGDGSATLREEMEYAGNYLELMKQRYEDSFEYAMEMDPFLTTCRVSKLLIQPVCENCFKHAFGSCEDIRKIQVRAFHQDSWWYVTVEDNGCGISQEACAELEEFQKSLSLETMRSSLRNSSIGGLSLKNICMRMFLLYGENYVLQVRNTGSGTMVTLGGSMDDQNADCGG